jgi:hypothetical protein
MAGIFVANGESVAGQLICNKITTAQNLVLKLYQNNHTPGYSDAVGAFTEATFTGYSAITLTGASWTASGSDPTALTYAQQSFASTANQTAQTIYGYFLIRATAVDLIAAELFATPIVIQYNGDTINITPTLNFT